jgi:hypothetical protein
MYHVKVFEFVVGHWIRLGDLVQLGTVEIVLGLEQERIRCNGGWKPFFFLDLLAGPDCLVSISEKDYQERALAARVASTCCVLCAAACKVSMCWNPRSENYAVLVSESWVCLHKSRNLNHHSSCCASSYYFFTVPIIYIHWQLAHG